MKDASHVRAIVEAERQASALAAEARGKKLRLHEDLRTEAETMRRKYIEQAERRIEAVREREIKQTSDAIEGLKALHTAETESMERLFLEHRDEWVNALYSRVLEGV